MKKTLSFILLIAFFVCPLLISDVFALCACPGNLDDLITTPLFGYEVKYTNDSVTDPDYLSTTQAQRAADALDDHHQSFLDIGSLAPFFTTSPSQN